MANDKNCINVLHAKERRASSIKWLAAFSSLGVCAVFILLIKLGFWQLERAQEKLKLKQLHAQNQQVTLSSFPKGDIDERFNQQHIAVSGDLLHQYTWLVDNQVKNGKVGYEVLVALALPNEQRLAIVNLGWVAAPATRDQLPRLKEWAGTRDFTGQLHVPVANPYTIASVDTNDWPKRIAQVDISMAQQHSSLKLFGAVLRLSQGSAVGYDKTWRWSNKMTVDKHNGYAFQWFALAATLLILSTYFGYQRIKEV